LTLKLTSSAVENNTNNAVLRNSYMRPEIISLSLLEVTLAQEWS